MQTVVIVLDPGKLENPDLDLRYLVPDRIEEISNGKISDNGYDYIDRENGKSGPFMAIWLETDSAAESVPVIVKLFQEEKFLDNDLFKSAEIYISEKDSAEIENCTLVFPK